MLYHTGNNSIVMGSSTLKNREWTGKAQRCKQTLTEKDSAGISFFSWTLQARPWSAWLRPRRSRQELPGGFLYLPRTVPNDTHWQTSAKSRSQSEIIPVRLSSAAICRPGMPVNRPSIFRLPACRKPMTRASLLCIKSAPAMNRLNSLGARYV